MRYFVTGHEMLLYLSGDREEHKEECCFELPDFESKEEAVAAAREFIKEHKNAVNDQKHGIGSVTYWTADHVVHGKALQAGGCRRPHRIRVDGQGARVACRRARDACCAAMARTMARSRVDTCLGRVKRCFSHALIFAA